LTLLSKTIRDLSGELILILLILAFIGFVAATDMPIEEDTWTAPQLSDFWLVPKVSKFKSAKYEYLKKQRRSE